MKQPFRTSGAMCLGQMKGKPGALQETLSWSASPSGLGSLEPVSPHTPVVPMSSPEARAQRGPGCQKTWLREAIELLSGLQVLTGSVMVPSEGNSYPWPQGVQSLCLNAGL